MSYTDQTLGHRKRLHNASRQMRLHMVGFDVYHCVEVSHIICAGFQARISTLDYAKGRIMTDGPTIIVTASFEGRQLLHTFHFIPNIGTPRPTRRQCTTVYILVDRTSRRRT